MIFLLMLTSVWKNTFSCELRIAVFGLLWVEHNWLISGRRKGRGGLLHQPERQVIILIDLLQASVHIGFPTGFSRQLRPSQGEVEAGHGGGGAGDRVDGALLLAAEKLQGEDHGLLHNLRRRQRRKRRQYFSTNANPHSTGSK